MAVFAQTQTGLPCWYCGAFLIVELALGIYNKVIYNLLRFLKSLNHIYWTCRTLFIAVQSGMSDYVHVLDRDAFIGLIDLVHCKIILR